MACRGNRAGKPLVVPICVRSPTSYAATVVGSDPSSLSRLTAHRHTVRPTYECAIPLARRLPSIRPDAHFAISSRLPLSLGLADRLPDDRRLVAPLVGCRDPAARSAPRRFPVMGRRTPRARVGRALRPPRRPLSLVTCRSGFSLFLRPSNTRRNSLRLTRRARGPALNQRPRHRSRSSLPTGGSVLPSTRAAAPGLSRETNEPRALRPGYPGTEMTEARNSVFHVQPQPHS